MSDIDVLQYKLDKLAALLRRRKEELTKFGEFSDIHQTLLTEIQDRSDALRKRVTKAEESGSTRKLIRAELARDVSSLFDDFLMLEDRLDANMMKKQAAD